MISNTKMIIKNNMNEYLQFLKNLQFKGTWMTFFKAKCTHVDGEAFLKTRQGH